MKNIIIACCIVLAAVPAKTYAQGEPERGQMSLGANFEVSVPMGDFANIAEVGYGGNARYQYGSGERAAFTLTAGYAVWGKKEFDANNSVQPKAFNVFLGGKYYVMKNLYGSLEAGVYFLSYNRVGTRATVEGSTSLFMVPMGLGYQQSGFEAGVRYMLVDVDFNSFLFSVGYNFML